MGEVPTMHDRLVSELDGATSELTAALGKVVKAMALADATGDGPESVFHAEATACDVAQRDLFTAGWPGGFEVGIAEGAAWARAEIENLRHLRQIDQERLRDALGVRDAAQSCSAVLADWFAEMQIARANRIGGSATPGDAMRCVRSWISPPPVGPLPDWNSANCAEIVSWAESVDAIPAFESEDARQDCAHLASKCMPWCLRSYCDALGLRVTVRGVVILHGGGADS